MILRSISENSEGQNGCHFAVNILDALSLDNNVYFDTNFSQASL